MGNLDEGAPLLGILEGVHRKALEMGLSLHMGPTGEPGRGLIYREGLKVNEGGL
jgi:hypothetical protein